MAIEKEQMQNILDRTVNDIVGDDQPEQSEKPPVERAPRDRSTQDIADELLQKGAFDEPDESEGETHEETQAEHDEGDEDEQEAPQADVEEEQKQEESAYELLTEDGFVAQGEEGPLLYAGQDDKGKDVWLAADEVFGDAEFHIPAAGEERKVTFAEMVKGYQRQADYTRAKTQLADEKRTIDANLALVHMFQNDNGFRQIVGNYVNGVKELSGDIEAEIDKALDDGDTAKAQQLRQKRKALLERQGHINAAQKMQEEQNQLAWKENQRLAAELIPDYNSNMSLIRDYMKDEGYDDYTIANVEYLPPLAQKTFFTAAMANRKPQTSRRPTNSLSQKALQGKKRTLVRRPPKAPRSGPAQNKSENASKQRRAKALFAKAHRTGSMHDMAAAVAEVLPDDYG